MQWVFNTYALAAGTAREVVKRGGDTWFFMTADYAFGQALERDAGEVVKQAGGKVVGAVRHPFVAMDLTSFVLQAQASRAKIIGLASGPPDNTNAIKIGGEFGLFQSGQQMAALLILITDIHALGLRTAQGLLLTTSFYWDMDDKTRGWSKRFMTKMNRAPTMWQAGVYFSVAHYLKAIKTIGTDASEEVAAQMRAMPVEDFFSRHGKLREDGLMVHDVFLVQVKKPEQSKYPWDYFEVQATIPGNEAFQPPDPACALVKRWNFPGWSTSQVVRLVRGRTTPGPRSERSCSGVERTSGPDKDAKHPHCAVQGNARRQSFELADIAANARRGKHAAAISPVALAAVKRARAIRR